MDWPLITEVVGVMCFAFGIVCLPCGLYLKGRAAKAEKTCTVPMKALVIERQERVIARRNRLKETAWYPVVQFDWDGITRQVETGVGVTEKNCPRVGETLDIMVDPANPANVFVPNARGENPLPLLISGAILLPIGIVLCIPLLIDIFTYGF